MMSSSDNKGESDTSKEDKAKPASGEASKQAPERQESSNVGDISSDAVLSDSLLKALRRKTSSLGGGSNGSGDNSDNSGLASFGFNFDTDDAIINPASLGVGSDGSGGGISPPSVEQQEGTLPRKSSMDEPRYTCSRRDASAPVSESGTPSSATSGGKSSVSYLTNSSHNEAAAEAVASLNSIASSYSPTSEKFADQVTSSADLKKPPARSTRQSGGKKRPASSRSLGENDSGGYNSDDSSNDDEVRSTTSSKRSTTRRPKKKKKLDESKREERNAREKERSYRITKQINELRGLLSKGGVSVPKGTKSSVLSEAANYIRMLQQHQYRSEIDRHQLVQQMQMIGGGTLGPQAASAVRHVAAQNGLWSLGNFGGVPPKSAMSFYQGKGGGSTTTEEQEVQSADATLSPSIADHEYRFVFNSCAVGMAIASMGGAFIDCNQLFTQLSGYTKQEVCAMTVFNLTSQEDLQQAFDLISQMISPPVDARLGNQPPKSCVLRGKMKERSDLGLNVGLIRDQDKIAKCFCVTLIKNPSSCFDTSKPVPATADLINSQSTSPKEMKGTLNTGPAYTTG